MDHHQLPHSMMIEREVVFEEEPKDKYHLAYMIHFLLGAGYLIPWNAFITAVDYFQVLYPSKHVNKVFSVGYMSAAVIVLFTLMYWSRSNRVKLPSVRTRMNMGQALFVVALMVPPVTDWIDHGDHVSSTGSNIEFVVLVTMVMICGLADGLVGGSLIGSTGELPERYMQAVFAGNAIAGLMTSALRIITKASLPHNQKGLRSSAHIYFSFSAFLVLLCIICTNVLHKLPVIQFYRTKKATDPNPNPTHRKSIDPNFFGVFKKIRWPVAAVFSVYLVSISIFPGYLSENVKSSHFTDWYPILLITTFNFGDLIGKLFTTIYVPVNSKVVVLCSVGRVLFYPFFVGCIYGPNWMRSETSVIVLTLILGLTNGYLTSVLMMLAPKLVHIDKSEVVGIIMQTFLFIGLVLGSVVAWIWNFAKVK
ncbi:equilibrative nucleotide transporter 8-like [Rutidosis leptorrhynchoides]|uniref:equilibrative nucleotide transporter 8-like n=1 Tax=Rutidosis leptorrhynchoides TaxID=125765 RepID=UPI003A9997B5